MGQEGLSIPTAGAVRCGIGLAIEFIPGDFEVLVEGITMGFWPGFPTRKLGRWTDEIERVVSFGIDVKEGFQGLAQVLL